METEAYIRPCAMFPDGWLFPQAAVEELLEEDLIESAYGWAENATELDFYPLYDDDTFADVERSIDRIIWKYTG